MDGAFPTSRSSSPRWEPYGRPRGEERLDDRLRHELGEGSAGMRLRAASRLVERHGAGAAAAVEEALSKAEDPELRAALIERLAAAQSPRSFPVIRRCLDDRYAEVRAAAAAAAVRLAPEGLERDELLSLVFADEDPRVRRRALIALSSLRGLDPGPRVAALTADPDRHCRRLACVALASTREPEAALALVAALRDEDAGVRAAAESAAARLFGERVAAVTDLEGWERGRAIARLRAWVSTQPPSAWSTAGAGADEGEEGSATLRPGAPLEGEAERVGGPLAEAGAARSEREEPEAPVGAESAGTAPGEGAEESAEEQDAWTEQIELSLRAALRGATLAELVEATGASEALLSPWIETLIARGKIVRRGRKFYFP